MIYKKRKIISKQVLDAKSDTKRLYKIMSSLTGSNVDNPMPEAMDNASLAQRFADYFDTKILKIREKFEGATLYEPNINEDVPPLRSFSILTQEQVKSIISDTQSKSCELDPIPTKLL